MTRIDLDAVAARYEQAQQHRYLVHLPQIADVVACATDVPTLVAELRAARAVVAAVPGIGRLRALADWLDMDDRVHGRAYDEVQRDLRALADALAAYTQEAHHA